VPPSKDWHKSLESCVLGLLSQSLAVSNFGLPTSVSAECLIKDAQIYRRPRPNKRPQLWYKQTGAKPTDGGQQGYVLRSSQIGRNPRQSDPAIRPICVVPAFISEHLSLALSSRVCDTIWHQITCRLQIRKPEPRTPNPVLRTPSQKHPAPPLAWPSPLPFVSRTPRRTRSPIWSQQSLKRRTEREKCKLSWSGALREK